MARLFDVVARYGSFPNKGTKIAMLIVEASAECPQLSSVGCSFAISILTYQRLVKRLEVEGGSNRERMKAS